jgi:hypothetical protein
MGPLAFFDVLAVFFMSDTHNLTLVLMGLPLPSLARMNPLTRNK